MPGIQRGIGIGLARQGSNSIPVVEPSPVFSSATTANFAENATGTVITVIASPVDSYSIKAGGDGVSFNINSSTGIVTFKTSPDYETKNSYTLTVIATKGSKTTEQTITITVTNVDESAAISSPTQTAITDTTATVGATLDCRGLSTVWSIEYGATTGYGSTQAGGTTSVNGVKTVGLTGLPQNSTIHWRFKAVNSDGTTYSTDQTITTLITLEFNLAFDGHSFLSPMNSLSSTVHYQIQPQKYYNGAVAGTTIAQSVTRQSILNTQIVSETGNIKNILLIYSGANDVTNSAGTGLTAYNALKSAIQSELSAGWECYVFTMTKSIFGGKDARFETERNVFNGKLRTDLSTLSRVYILDTDTISELNNPADTNYYIDLLHPARLACNLMSNLFINKLKERYSFTSREYVSSQIACTLTSAETGEAVGSITLTPSQVVTATITGNARFYTDTAGTLGESTTVTIPALVAKTIYYRCATGTSDLLFSNDDIVSISSIVSPTNAPKFGCNISHFKNMTYVLGLARNLITGSIANLIFMSTAGFTNSNLTYEDLTKLKDLSYLNIGLIRDYTSAEINKILANVVSNKDYPKTSANRQLLLSGYFATGAPTGQGITDKNTLLAYRTPFNNAAYSLWTVTTR